MRALQSLQPLKLSASSFNIIIRASTAYNSKKSYSNGNLWDEVSLQHYFEVVHRTRRKSGIECKKR